MSVSMPPWVVDIFQSLKNQDYEAANSLRLKNTPKSLYQYHRFATYPGDEDRLLNVEIGAVKFSNVSSFNDPYDCWVSVGRMKENLENTIKVLLESNQANELKKRYGVEKFERYKKMLEENAVETIKTISNVINGRSRGTLKAICLSETHDNILLWSHYGAHHKGFCIEYGVAPEHHHFWPVIYRTDVFDSTELNELNESVSRYVDKDGNLIPPDISDKPKFESHPYFALICAFIKAANWSYEKEWRAIYIASGDVEVSMDIPITGIYVGSEASNENLSRVCEIAKRKNIPVYKMQMDMAQYRLQAKQVPAE